MRCWLCVALLLSTANAAAEDDEERAKRLFFEGHQAADAGDHGTACERFLQSVKLFRRVSTVLNLGKCNDELGRLATALAYWREGAAMLESTDERFALAKARIADLEQRAPRVDVTLPPLVEGAIVAIDGQARNTATLGTVFLDPGEHVFTVDAPGHATWRTTLTLAEGQHPTLALMLGAPIDVPQPVDTPPPPPSDLGDSQRLWGFVAGGVGLAGVTVGAITGALAIDKKSTVEEQCTGDVCATQEGLDAAEAGRSLAIVSTATFIAGGALVGLGVVLVLTAPTAEITAELTPGAGDAGVGLTLRF